VLTRRVSFLGSISLFLTGLALGGQSIPNWAAPATWSPSRARGGLSAMDVTNPLPFIGLAPCRIVDTRGNGAPITGGMFTGGSDVRSYAVSGICGIPASAQALSLNFTVTGPGQTTAGFLLAWPTGGAVPPVSILNWDHVPAQIANAAVVPTNASTSFTVNVSTPTHVIIDTNGYYASFPADPQNFFHWENNSTFLTMLLQNASFSCTGACGLQAFTNSGIAIEGKTLGSTAGSAGVRGVAGGLTTLAYSPAGVRGESSSGYGVLGITRSGSGVGASLVDSTGTQVVYALLAGAGSPNYAVYGGGNFGGTGAKYFVEPHPTDPSRVIRYVSLEGPEAGTYFRGRGKFENRRASIEIPEDFRMVTDSEGLSIQVTPIGEFASVAVAEIELSGIRLKASRDVEFFYTVNGVRSTHKDIRPIGPGSEFIPPNADARMPAYLTEGQKAMLVSNGTYREDGTVNLETAERLGWTKAWRDREEQARAAAAANAAAHAARLAETK